MGLVEDREEQRDEMALYVLFEPLKGRYIQRRYLVFKIGYM